MLTLYPVPGKEKSKVICRAFAAGAPAHATGSVFFGTEGVMQQFQRAQSGTWFYIDNAYTDPQRGQYFRVTKNALQVDGALRYSDGKRFARLGIQVSDWRDDPNGHILVIPQSDDFMKSTLGRKSDWTHETIQKLKAWAPDRRLHIRPWTRDKTVAYRELHADLIGASLLVTWSSAAAITALYEGIPAISESGAASALTGPLTSESIATPRRPTTAERTRFLEILADNQWTLDEMRDGIAWRALCGIAESSEKTCLSPLS